MKKFLLMFALLIGASAANAQIFEDTCGGIQTNTHYGIYCQQVYSSTFCADNCYPANLWFYYGAYCYLGGADDAYSVTYQCTDTSAGDIPAVYACQIQACQGYYAKNLTPQTPAAVLKANLKARRLKQSVNTNRA